MSENQKYIEGGAEMPRKNGLTKKEKAFCEEYVINGGSATKAYLTAYECAPNTASAFFIN